MKRELGLGVWFDLGDYSLRPGDARKRIHGDEIRLLAKHEKMGALGIAGKRKQALKRGQGLKRFLRLLKTVLNKFNELPLPPPSDRRPGAN